jgi:uncharacterized membrane protein YbhN (UPF0104 family)
MSPPVEVRATTRRRWWRSRLVQSAASLAVIVAIFVFLFPRLADYGEVWRTIADMTAVEIASLLVVAAWNLVSYWPMLTAVQPGLRTREAAVSNLASTAIANTLPGGGAIGVGVTVTMQRSWGISLSEVALASVVSGIWNNFVKLGLPVVALALLAFTGDVGPGLSSAAAAGVAVLAGAIGVFAVLLRSPRHAALVGTAAAAAVGPFLRLVRRPRPSGWGSRTATLRAEIIGLLRQRGVRITVTTLISHLSLYLVLLVALRHVGVSGAEVGWAKVLAGFAFVRLLSAIPITPGGLGVVELGLTAALGTGLPDPTQNSIAAAVLVYRALTWFVPIPLGMVCWVFWRANTSWLRTNAERRAWLDGPQATGTPPAAATR